MKVEIFCKKCGKTRKIRHGGKAYINKHLCLACANKAKEVPIQKRFWKYIDKGDDSGCWPWLAGKDKDGYGKSYLNKKSIRAHRLAFELFNGKIPEGLNVLHSCDNPTCVNPKHLWLGTNNDNMQDKTKKGRNNAPNGERSGTSKLTLAKVKKIRQMYDTNQYTYKKLSELFITTISNISFIINKKTWQNP